MSLQVLQNANPRGSESNLATPSLEGQELSTVKPSINKALEKYGHLVSEWFSNLGDECAVNLPILQSSFRVTCRCIAAEDLRDLFDNSKLYFRERVIHAGALRDIRLEDLSSTFETPAHKKFARPGHMPGPVILLQQEDGFIVLQGNHRVFKGIASNPEALPVFAVVFSDLDAYEKLFEIRPNLKGPGGLGYTRPGMIA